MRKDLHHNLSAKPALNSLTINSDTLTNGEIIDLKGFGSVEFLIQSEAITDGNFEPQLEEGNQSDLSDAQPAADHNLLGTKAEATFTNADGNLVKKVGYKVGNYRYVRLNLNSTGVTSGGTFSAMVVLGTADYLPVT